MKYLNLSGGTDFICEPSLDCDIIRFPSGFESTLRLKEAPPEEVTIVARIETASDILLIGQAVDVLRRGLMSYCENPYSSASTKVQAERINLFLPFVPNARQDRSMLNGDCFGLKVFANYINSFNFDRVLVFDPHSSVTPALINNCEVIPQAEFAAPVISADPRPFKIIAPDAGSLKKAEAIGTAVGKEVIHCHKTRDPVSGTIGAIQVYGDVDKSICYICDDIACGGMTFILLTKKLLELDASEVNLVISHGIFSKGLEPLYKAGINKIYTTNSFNHRKNIENSGGFVEFASILQVTDIRPLLKSYL